VSKWRAKALDLFPFFPVATWPMQVHVYIPLVEAPELRDHINVAETKKIALGEIRRRAELQN